MRIDRALKKIPKLNYHRIKCKICKHPNRNDIEKDYAHFLPLKVIFHKYNLDLSADWTSFYRHVHAFQLHRTRDRSILLNQVFDLGLVNRPSLLDVNKYLDEQEGKAPLAAGAVKNEIKIVIINSPKENENTDTQKRNSNKGVRVTVSQPDKNIK